MSAPIEVEVKSTDIRCSSVPQPPGTMDVRVTCMTWGARTHQPRRILGFVLSVVVFDWLAVILGGPL